MLLLADSTRMNVPNQIGAFANSNARSTAFTTNDYWQAGIKTTCDQKYRQRNQAISPKISSRIPTCSKFIGIKQNTDVYESDLEKALIGELERFLLELGRGFAFVARQKHIDLDGDHFYIDLVFYNFILKCFVLIDLKTEKLTHQDIGQMDTYVRIYDQLQRGEDDNPTIGIILCSEKNEAIVKYSILNDSKQIFASRYQLTLPTEEELKQHIEFERRRLEERKDIL